jgi:hypothetical protein
MAPEPHTRSPILLNSNGGSIFEPPFNQGRRPSRGDHARGRQRLPRPRVRRGRDARDRRGRRPLARQPLSLLPRQGRAALLLPGSHGRSPAGRPGCRQARPARAAAPPQGPGRRARPLPGRRGGGVGGASRGERAAPAPARADRRQARPLRARRARPGRRRRARRHAASRRRHHRHPRLSRRPELDRALVPPRGPAIASTNRGSGRRLRRQWTPPCQTTCNSR